MRKHASNSVNSLNLMVSTLTGLVFLSSDENAEKLTKKIDKRRSFLINNNYHRFFFNNFKLVEMLVNNG